HTGMVRCLAFSPDGKRILSGSADRTLRLWDAATGAELLRMEDAAGAVNAVAFLPGDRAITGSGGKFETKILPKGGELRATLGKSGAVRVWDLKTGQMVSQFPEHPAPVYGIAVRGKGQVTTVSADGTLQVWQMPERE